MSANCLFNIIDPTYEKILTKVCLFMSEAKVEDTGIEETGNVKESVSRSSHSSKTEPFMQNAKKD